MNDNKRYYECTKCMFGGPCYIHHYKYTIKSVSCVKHEDDIYTPKWKRITKEIYEENRNN